MNISANILWRHFVHGIIPNGFPSRFWWSTTTFHCSFCVFGVDHICISRTSTSFFFFQLKVWKTWKNWSSRQKSPNLVIQSFDPLFYILRLRHPHNSWCFVIQSVLLTFIRNPAKYKKYYITYINNNSLKKLLRNWFEIN